MRVNKFWVWNIKALRSFPPICFIGFVMNLLRNEMSTDTCRLVTYDLLSLRVELNIRLTVDGLVLRCGQGVGPPLAHRAFTTWSSLQSWWDHPRETVPLLMREGEGGFPRLLMPHWRSPCHLRVLWSHSQWFRPYLGLSFSSLSPRG